MAEEGKRFTTRTSNILSRVGKSANANQQQAASSSAAAKSGSTTTPTVTKTPKVTNTAKAMPSITRPSVSTIISRYSVPKTTQATTTQKAQVPDLLANRTGTNPLKKADTTNLLNPSTEEKKIRTSALPLTLVKAAKNQGGAAEQAVNKTLNEQFSYWFNEVPEKITNKVGDLFKKPVEAFGTQFESMISDAEYWVAGLADVIETSLGGTGGFKQAFQEQQGQYWDTYGEALDTKAANLYNEDQQAQNITDRVSDWLWIRTGNREISDMLGSVAGRVTATVKDPEQVAGVVGYMAPALILQAATGGGFLAGTMMWLPSQSTNVYKDFAEDEELSSKFTDNQLFGVSTGLGTVLAMVETFGDALGDMPWAKSMSRTIRNTFTKTIKKETKEVLSKELTDMIDESLIKSARRPVMNALNKWFAGSMGEGVEEVIQDTIQTESARALGSKREGMSVERLLTTGLTAGIMGLIIQGPGTAINIKNNQDLKKQYNEFSNTIDKIAPGINKETKEAFFSAMITSQQNDANLSERKVDKYERQTTELYNQISNLENQLETTTDENAKKSISEQIDNLNNQINEIDKKINQWNNTREQINEYIREYNEESQEEQPATQQEMASPDTTEQEVKDVDTISEGTWDASESKESFDKSIQQIKNGTEYYNTDFAKNYAYKTSGRYILGDTEQNQQMINKVQKLLKGIGINMRISKGMKNTRGLYDSGVVYYKEGNKELTLYGHEVFHAMMDVINNGKLDDAELQAELQDILNQAIEEVKKQFGIDGYKSGKELEYANKYAEEWLANAFGEYLEEREIEGPKTFVEKIIAFFNQILDLLSGKEKKSINKELKKAFDKIASGEVTGRRGIPKMVSMPSASPIESSTDESQEYMKEVKGEEYDNIVKENQLQSEQQEELGEHSKEIMEAGKQSDKEVGWYNDGYDAEVLDDLKGQYTTANTIKNAFGKDKKKKKKAFSIMKTEAVQAAKDAFTPAFTRIYNISPRVAGRMAQMETHKEVYTYRYREQAKQFVSEISKLKDKDKFEVKKALLDYGALASEQIENIEQYKEEEKNKLKEVFKKYGISEKAANDMFAMLNELGQKYKDAGLSITLTDMYFPRTVTDYEGLTEYISEKTGTEGKAKQDLLNRIAKIERDEKLSDAEKEKKIRQILISDYHTPSTTSKHGKERKLGRLSDWGDGIYQFYADPMESLDSYIVTMVDAIEKQLFLGGLQEEAGLKGENVSLSEIVEGLVEQGMISNEDLEELKKSVLSVLNKKPSTKIVTTMKSMVYIATLTNFLSAINQLDDLGVAILKDKNGLKHVVKAIFGKAGIKYTDLGLEDSYEMFRGQGNVTNWLFKKSFFSAFDRLGKTSFVNAAWDSLVRQAKKNKDGTDSKSRIILMNRLRDMYGEKTMQHMMEKIDENDYHTNGQIDIDILTDLLYQLGSTQPIFSSAMPTAYLNNPWARLCYALQSFMIKRIDFLIQGTKQVYKQNGGGASGAVNAGAWLMYVSTFLAMFGVAIGDLQDWIKGDEDETVLWKLMNEGIDSALKEVWHEGKASWLKIWNLSLYDKKTYQRQGLRGVIMNKVKPPIIGIGENFVEAITEHNEDEMTDLVQYVPIVGKLLYYWFFDEMGKATGELELDLGDDFELDLDDFELDLDEDFELNI